jgi:hypothetical protein
MTNRARGDAELDVGGRIFCLRLTLGALAEIEDGLALDDLSQIEARLKKLRAADLAIVAAALMRGGGHDMTPLEALRLPVALPDLVRALSAAFAAGGSAATGNGEEDNGARGPFAGHAGSKSGSA